MSITDILAVTTPLFVVISTMAGYILRNVAKERDEHKAESDRRGSLIIAYAMSDQTEDDAREFRRQAMEIFGGGQSSAEQPKMRFGARASGGSG